MGRAERRRAEREQRRAQRGNAGAQQDSGRHSWTPPTGRITSTQSLNSPDDVARQTQEFLAGAGVVIPDQGPTGQPAPMPPLFTVFVNDDDSTYGPAPQLREAFRLLDQHGAVKLNKMLTVGTAWTILDSPDGPLAKLKLEFHSPIAGNTAIVLIAQNYADCWKHIVNGGIIAITTFDRLNQANQSTTHSASSPLKPPTDRMTRLPNTGTFADAMNASILLGIGTSPGIKYLMDNHGW